MLTRFVLLADLGFLALQVILALGNRPKAERLTYTISIAVFAVFAAYLIFCTVILTIKAFCVRTPHSHEAEVDSEDPGEERLEIDPPPLFFSLPQPISALLKDSDASSISVFLGSTYGPIFAGIAGTFGVFCSLFTTLSPRLADRNLRTGTYIVSGLLYLEPWHIFHSMPQYLLIAPSFTNILNVYAFCNLHDVSWGTKGSDTVDKLPAVQSSKDGTEKVVEATQMVQEGAFFSFVDVFPSTLLTPFSRRHRYLVQGDRSPRCRTFRR